jgi:hypothetical protein
LAARRYRWALGTGWTAQQAQTAAGSDSTGSSSADTTATADVDADAHRRSMQPPPRYPQ